MPYKTRKVRNKNCYKVVNINTNKVHAKCTSLENAKKQIKLLNAIEHGFKPRQRSPKKSPKRLQKKSPKRSPKKTLKK